MIKIVCLIKFIPDMSKFKYDYEKNVLIRENVNLVINPEDEKALATAFKLKEKLGAKIHVITMAPLGVIDKLRDLARIGADEISLVSDKNFVGSDTYATTIILSKAIETVEDYDYIFSGTHTLDGSTAHIPSQIAEYFDLSTMAQVSNVIEAHKNCITLEVEEENKLYKFKVNSKAVISFNLSNKNKLPFVKYADMNLFVDDKINILEMSDLSLSKDLVGFTGSKTKVVKTYVKQQIEKERIIVDADENGVEIVYNFLKDKGFLHE